jgi:uncharacterized protein
MKLNKLGRIALLVTALSLLAPVTANSANAAGRYITVYAVGVVKAVPDAVKVMGQVSVVGTTTSSALASANTSSAAVRKAIFANGVAAKDLATTSMSVAPEYNYTPDKGSVQVGYRASQSFTITVRNASNAGTIVDAIVAAGGDNLQLNGVSPFITDDTKATLAARSAAIANAKSKAASYAKLLGVKLGKVNYIVENSSAIPTPIYSVAKADAATSIDLGTQDVSVSITVQWSII